MSGGLHDLDAIRRSVSLVGLVARRVKLRRAGRGWSGLCPFHQERTPSFTVSDEKGFYHCFGCQAHGDHFDWLVETTGCGFKEAVQQLADPAGVVPRSAAPIAQREAKRSAGGDIVGSATVGRWIWATSGPARGEIVEGWLEARGLDPRAEFVPGTAAIDGLAFHPRCPVVPWKVHEEPGNAWLTAPAMVAPIADSTGAVWGVHCTYLSPDGRSKAALPKAQGQDRPTRKMWGKVGGNAVWLEPFEGHTNSQPAPNLPLIVGEGIETCWAFAQGFGRACRVAATLSLENLQGGAMRLRDGSLPLWRPVADPERAPFLVADAGEVIVLADADMKPLRNQKVQLARGAMPVRADISSLQRSELCAALAVQHWRAAGATKVSAVRPPMGMDFNDVARRAAA